MALGLVLGLILVLGAFAAALRLLSHSAYREIDVVNGHLRAIAVAEIGFATAIGRLTAAPWPERWFRSGPDVQLDVPATGGSYSWMIRDAPRRATFTDPLAQATLGSPNQADLLIRATSGQSRVLMYWRLTLPDDSLDALATVIPTYFAHGPESAPLTPGTADALTGEAEDGLRKRAGNTPRYEGIDGPLRRSPPEKVGEVLGVDPGGPVVDGVTPPDGTGPDIPPPPPEAPGETPEPPPLVPPDPPSIEGLWYGPPQTRALTDDPGSVRTVRDHLYISRDGDVVSGTCQYLDEFGVAWTTWSFSAPLNGNTFQFDSRDLQSTVTNGRPTPFRETLAMDPTGQVLAGTATTAAGGTIPVRFTREP
jgi:hypothetical protein